VRRYVLSPQFLRDFRVLEPGMSPADQDILDGLLAAVVANPEMPRRAQTFYDPARPSWLVRSDPFVVHYAHDPDVEEVEFLNLFRRR
jgi:hypothetical protein